MTSDTRSALGFVRHVRTRISSEPRKARFVASRVLWATGTCRAVTFQVPDAGRMRFWPTSISAALWTNHDFRADDVRVIRALLSPGDIYVDVGANVGHLALAAASAVGPSGKVLAIEPHPRIARYLKANARLAGKKHVETVVAAVGRAEGTAQLSNMRSDDQNHLTARPSDGPKVRMSTLDAIAPRGPISLLKVDVEGAEPDVLAGATSTLARTRFAYVELAPANLARYGFGIRDVLEPLAQAEMSAFTLENNRLQPLGRQGKSATTNIVAVRADDLAEANRLLHGGEHQV